jgi:hypothetical protein
MLDGYKKVYPPNWKRSPYNLPSPKLLVEMAYQPGSAQIQWAIADLTMIVFYYILRVGEYTVKGLQNNTKQTIQFNTRISHFLRRTCVANSVASHAMLPQISLPRLTALGGKG